MNNFGILFDLDGVVYQGEELIAGARESIRILRQNNIPFRFITNTTRMTKIKLVALSQVVLYSHYDFLSNHYH